jgi:hypothetical protein
MRSVPRYRIVVEGRLSSRFANSLTGVELEPHPGVTALLAELETAVELDALLERLGDLGLEVVSLGQQRGPA